MNIPLLRWGQFFQSVAIFILPCFLVAWMWHEKPLAYLHLTQKVSYTQLLTVAAVVILALPGINLLAYINEQLQLPAFMAPVEAWMMEMEQSLKEITRGFLQSDLYGVLAVNLLVMAVTPGIGEELFFRGVVQNLLGEKCNPHLTIWITAIIFSAIHLQFYGFIPRMLIGAFLGYLLWWSGSMWVPIVAHFTNNATAVLAYFVGYKNGWELDTIEAFGSRETIWLGVVSLVVTAGLIYWLRRSLTMSRASSRRSEGN